MRRRTSGGISGIALAVILVAASCSDSGRASFTGDTLPAGAWPDEELADPVGFTVGSAPEGYVAVLAGDGVAEPYLSDDSCGTIEASLLVARDGWDPTSMSGFVSVRAVRYDGLEGGFSQAIPYSGDPPRRTETEVDGLPAVYTEGDPRDGEGWPGLIVDLGEPWALRVTGPAASLGTLRAFAEAAHLDEAHRPVLGAVPDGWGVVSRMTPEQATVSAGSLERDRSAPGRLQITGRGMAFADPEDSPLSDPGGDRYEQRPTIVVASVPGSQAHALGLSLLRTDATSGCLAAGRLESVQPVQVDGAEGWVSTTDTGVTLAYGTEGGALILIGTQGDPLLDATDLVEMAESIDIVDDAAWAAVVTETNGGAGLHPDPGHAELTRGTFEGIDWLLQNGTRSPFIGGEFGWEGSEDLIGGENWPVPLTAAPDDCMLFGSGQRQCQSSVGSDAVTIQVFYDRPADQSTPQVVFIVGMVKPDVVTVRVARPEGPEDVPTLDLPDTELRLFVVGHVWGPPAPELTYLTADGTVVETAL